MKSKIFIIAVALFVLINITCISAVENTQTINNTLHHNTNDFTTLNNNLNKNTTTNQLHKNYIYNSSRDDEYKVEF